MTQLSLTMKQINKFNNPANQAKAVAREEGKSYWDVAPKLLGFFRVRVGNRAYARHLKYLAKCEARKAGE